MPENRPFIRPPLPDDARHIAAMASEFAAYHEETSAITTFEVMTDVLGDNPRCHVLILETVEELIAGYSAGYFTYQIHKARYGFEVQSLFIREAHRHRGFGYALLRATAAFAVEKGCQRVTLGAEMTNLSAMRFYERIGFRPGRPGTAIQRYSLEGRDLREFAGVA